jgi:hypothetical protein
MCTDGNTQEKIQQDKFEFGPSRDLSGPDISFLETIGGRTVVARHR